MRTVNNPAPRWLTIAIVMIIGTLMTSFAPAYAAPAAPDTSSSANQSAPANPPSGLFSWLNSQWRGQVTQLPARLQKAATPVAPKPPKINTATHRHSDGHADQH